MKRANGASLETPQEIRKADGIKNTKNIPFGKKNKKKKEFKLKENDHFFFLYQMRRRFNWRRAEYRFHNQLTRRVLTSHANGIAQTRH